MDRTSLARLGPDSIAAELPKERDAEHGAESDPTEIESTARELRGLRQTMVAEFQRARWADLAAALERVARLAEHSGSRELCLRAQSLRECVRKAGRAESTSREDLIGQFDEVLFHFSHLEWKWHSASPGAFAG